MLIDKHSDSDDPIYKDVLKDNPLHDPPNLSHIRLESLYSRCSDLFDRKFKQQIKSDFCACYAELYFAATLRIRFSKPVEHLSDRGPDFYLPSHSIHFEVTAMKNGVSENRNSIPGFEIGKAITYPERQILLRITNSFAVKSKKLKRDIEKGIVKSNESIVIVISANGLHERSPMYYEDSFPEVVKALLPVSDPLYWINPDTMNVASKEYKWKSSIKKKLCDKEIDISTEHLLLTDNEHISAVIYTWYSAFDATEDENLGNDFFLVHNPLARNPIEKGLLPSGIEYFVCMDDDGFVIQKSKY